MKINNAFKYFLLLIIVVIALFFGKNKLEEQREEIQVLSFIKSTKEQLS